MKISALSSLLAANAAADGALPSFSEKFPVPSAQLPVGGGFGGHFNAEINPGANVSVASAARAPFTPNLAS